MKPRVPSPRSRVSRRGFTLIEILVSVAILTMCMALVAMIYTNTITAWRLAQESMDELHQGDFVIEQLVAALRSEAFFPNNPKVYGFWLEDRGTQSSAHDEVSFVTSSSAFIPSDSPLQNSLHRLFVTVGPDRTGHEGLSIRALPHIMKEMDKEKVEPWIVSARVTAFDCQVYDADLKSWGDSWDDTNKIPNLIKITLTIAPVHEDDPPMVISRVVEIPIAPAVTQAVASATSPAQVGTNAAAGAGGVVGIGSGQHLPNGMPVSMPGSMGRTGSAGTGTGSRPTMPAIAPTPGGSSSFGPGGTSGRKPSPLPPTGGRR